MRVLMLVMAIHAQRTEVACNDAVLAKAWALLREARYGQSAREHAAFVVLGRDGYSFVAWPYGASEYAAHYDGAIPANAVAIVHTHPNSHPMPSAEDEAVARRVGLPVYVVTRTMIARTGAVRVWDGDWKPDARGAARSVCGR
jgi:proteasome lid subunit RPN8/RPN11